MEKSPVQTEYKIKSIDFWSRHGDNIRWIVFKTDRIRGLSLLILVEVALLPTTTTTTTLTHSHKVEYILIHFKSEYKVNIHYAKWINIASKREQRERMKAY